MRAPFFADFAMGRRPISPKPYAGFVTEREDLLRDKPPRSPPFEAVFKTARYDGGLTTVSMQVGEYKLSPSVI